MCWWIRRWGQEEKREPLWRKEGVSSVEMGGTLLCWDWDILAQIWVVTLLLHQVAARVLMRHPLVACPSGSCFHWRNHLSRVTNKMKSFKDHIHELLTMDWGIWLRDMNNEAQSQRKRAGQEKQTHGAEQEPCLWRWGKKNKKRDDNPGTGLFQSLHGITVPPGTSDLKNKSSNWDRQQIYVITVVGQTMSWEAWNDPY